MQSRFINVWLTVLSLCVSVFLIVSVKACMAPVRTSVNLHNFEDEDYLFQPDDVLGFRPQSQVYVTAYAGQAQFDVYTDHRGGRVDQLLVEESRQSDIIGVGGSQTWGQGVPNQGTFLSVIARELGYSVSNLAISGFGGVGAFLRLRDNLDLAPKLVVYGFWEDHLNRNVKGCLEDASPVCVERPYLQRKSQREFDFVFPRQSEKNLERIRRFYLETATSTNRYRSLWTDMYWVSYDIGKQISTLWVRNNAVDVTSHEKWEATEFVLQEMNKLTTSVDAQFVVVWIPLYFSSDIANPPSELVTLSQKLGFVLVNLRDRFLSMKQSDIDIALPGDGHMNKSTHAMIASEIVASLAVDSETP